MSGPFYHATQRELQQRMQSVRIADRLEATRRHSALNETDRAIIGAAQYFFIASAAPDGRLDCSIKCGPAGFVVASGPGTLLFPDYDGNGMFRTLGNIGATGRVALLFLEFWGEKRKLRIHGTARLRDDAPALDAFADAQLAVEVNVTDIFPNCPRYLPSFEYRSPSEYVEALGSSALEPPWKSKPDLADYVCPRHKR